MSTTPSPSTSSPAAVTAVSVDASGKPKYILALVDAPDPDNFVQLIALHKLFPDAQVFVALTGRPVRFGATKAHATWEWDMISSRMAQEASAARAKNFLRHFGITVSRVFDGGIAPRTLVPHHIHFAEYYRFLDVDPLAAIRHSELEPQEELVKLLLTLPDKSLALAVGGPMTGLSQAIVRCPDIQAKFLNLGTMFATWGNVTLMQFDDTPRGAMQFNVACDPQAASFVLDQNSGLECPIYIMPTEVTRVKEIGFINAQSLRQLLPDNAGTRALYHLYALWYDAAVKPRQDKNPDELIYIHDVVAAFALDPTLREEIYDMVPVEIISVPCSPRNKAQWGTVNFRETTNPTNRFAAKGLKPGGAEKYLATLKTIFA